MKMQNQIRWNWCTVADFHITTEQRYCSKPGSVDVDETVAENYFFLFMFNEGDLIELFKAIAQFFGTYLFPWQELDDRIDPILIFVCST